MEYSVTGYRQNDLVLLDVKINGEMVEPLAAIVHRDSAYYVRACAHGWWHALGVGVRGGSWG